MTPPSRTSAAVRRLVNDHRDLAIAVGAMTAYALLRRFALPGAWHFTANVAMTIGLLGSARAARMSAPELGIARRDVRTGLRWGGAAFGVISAVLAIGAAIPATREFFEDDGADVGAGAMLRRALVVIPIGTVVFEEVAFRGVLLGLAHRSLPPRRAAVVVSVLFGLWHAPPLLDEGIVSVVGTVAATTVAGLGFVWLRVRSRSLVAPMMAHLATNSTAFVLAWLVERNAS